MSTGFPQPNLEKLPVPPMKKGDKESLSRAGEMKLVENEYITSEGIGNDSFAIFCRRPLIRIITRIIGDGHFNEVDDLVQEATLKAVLGLGGFKGKSSLSTWVSEIGKNEAFSFLRKTKVRKHIQEELTDDILRTKEDTVADPLTKNKVLENYDLL